MRLKSSDDFVDDEYLIGPMPNFSDSFESFFLPKALQLLVHKTTETDSDTNDSVKYVSLSDSKDLSWMREIQLSTSCREQNIEIIYNNNKIYFKTTKKILRDTQLSAFPSKDLEIALGLQYIPLSNDDSYSCKKCYQSFKFQYGLMLHMRYFCSFNPNNFIKSLLKASLIKENSDPDVNLAKRKQATASFDHNLNKRFKTGTVDDPTPFQSSWPFQSMVSVYPTINPALINQNIMSSMAKSHYPSNTGLISHKEQLLSYILGYMQNQHKPENLLAKKFNTTSTVGPTSVIASVSNAPLVNPYLPNLMADSIPSRLNKSEASFIPKPAVNRPIAAVSELLLNKQPIVQNWCAKCSIGFKLTTDLVNHMRTFHKKDSSPTSNLIEYGSNKLVNNSNKLPESELMMSGLLTSTHGSRSTSDVKSLRCDICNEVFKEKHHLSRHMTSHR